MSVEGFDANRLTKEERLAVLNGSKSLIDLGAIEPPHKGLPALLADLLPPDNPRDKNGEEKNHTAGSWANFVTDRLGGKLRFNDLTGLMEYKGTSLPVDETSLIYVRAQQDGHKVQEKQCNDALLTNAYQDRFDPIRDYLEHLERDVSVRPACFESLSSTYLGTNDPLYDHMLRVALLGAVHRRLNPGCQYDVVVVLKGDQGIRKSTFWKVLASPKWYCSSVPDGDKDLLLNVHSTWIFELAELENVTTKREVGQLKNLITTSSDHIRIPYGKASEEKERNSIFVSSVNGDTFLRDDTGHRRFLVIECPQSFNDGESIDVEAVIRDHNRIWKAAVLAYRQGDLPMLNTEQQLESNRRCGDYEISSPFEGLIERWLSLPNSPTRFTSDEALILSGCRTKENIKRLDQQEVTNVLTKLGWSKPKNKETINGFRGRFWKKTSNPTHKNDIGQGFGQQVSHL